MAEPMQISNGDGLMTELERFNMSLEEELARKKKDLTNKTGMDYYLSLGEVRALSRIIWRLIPIIDGAKAFLRPVEDE